MKSLVVAGLMLATSVSFAKSERKIFDIMYLPEAGTFFGSSEAAYALASAKLHSNTSGDIGDFDLSGYAVQQTFGYSLTSQLFVTSVMSYEASETKYDFKASGNETYKSHSESDPSLNVRYRVFEDSSLLDLLAGMTISTGAAKVADADHDGNIKQGGHSFNLGAQFGQKQAGLQYAVTLLGTHFIKAQKQTGGSSKTDVNAHQSYKAQVDVLHPLYEKAYLRSFASLTIVDAFNDENAARTEQETQINLGTEFQYALCENLLLRAGISYLDLENSVYDGIEVREDYLLQFLGAANYQF